MWKTVRLGDVCEFVRGPFGGSLKKNIFVEKGFAVYEQQHAIYNQCDNFRYYVTEEKFAEMVRFSVNPGDILMSCSGTIGKTTIVPPNAPAGIINQALLKITASAKLDVRFLKLFMESQLFGDQLMETVDGAAIQNVASVKVLKEIKINLPPLAEQQRIVEKLDRAFAEIDEIIEIKKREVGESLQIIEKTLETTFINAGKGWRKDSLKNITAKIGSGATPRGGRESYKNTGISLIRSMNVHDMQFVHKDLAKIDGAQAEKL